MKNILIVGRGVCGRSLKEYMPNADIISHNAVFSSDFSQYSVVVNCAGIAGTGVCEQAGHEAVSQANVDFPIKLAEMCDASRIKFIQLSTVGVYAPQVCPTLNGFQLLTEEASVKSHNSYIASKIAMEKALAEYPSYVLRLPWLYSLERFKERFSTWSHVQDTYVSIVEVETLANAICFIEKTYVPIGIYNIATCVVYFPFLAKLLGYNLPIRTDYPESMSSAVPVSTAKAEKFSIIKNRIFPKEGIK